jgi:ATP-dependent RNA helicase SUPV3L1/SUV3
MSKHKKQNKYNAIVKEIFDGDGFDEGILRLSSEELIEMCMHVDLKVSRMEDAELIRSLRRIWSEGEMHHRNEIVKYLQSLHKIFESTNSEHYAEKEQKLLEILASLDVTDDERKMLYLHFIEQKIKKINQNKIERFIARYREQAKYGDVAEMAGGKFTESASFEFYHAFDLELFGTEFKKIFVLYAKGLTDAQWQEYKTEQLVQILELQKEEEVYKFSKTLHNLISEISQEEHPYLSKDDRVKWLKSLEPESDIQSFALPFKLLYSIIKDHSNLHNLIITKSAVSAIKKATFTLSNGSFVYTYELTMPLWKISAMVLKAEPLTLDEELEKIDKAMQDSFILEYEALKQELLEEGHTLGMKDEEVIAFIDENLKENFQSEKSLVLTRKMYQHINSSFTFFTVDLRRQQQREALLARTIRDFKALFPVARSLKREIIFNVGPTNSGKTYEAMQALKNADTGVYLAPLRLLALEGYENLKELGVPTILLTGEEEIFDEDAGHVSSTIEMTDFETEVDVAIIDEIQMIGDRDRGWAWANALIGVPAKKIYLTGSQDALESVEALCEWLEEPLTIRRFERKTPQEILQVPTSLDDIMPGTALIAFSRNNVLKFRQKLSKKYKVSVIYGNLSPEVRREEARRFREGESDVLVATDAIAMGLNLPIKQILFTADNKYDGESQRPLYPTEVQQISGRAGRYGFAEVGYIGGISGPILKHIRQMIHEDLGDIKPPFKVMANFEHIKLVASILQTDNLEKIFGFFAKHMEFDGPFEAGDFQEMEGLAAIIDKYSLSLKDKFVFATAPVGRAPYIMEQFERYLKDYSEKHRVAYLVLESLPEFAQTENILLEVEDRIKEISLYLWLAYRFEDAFIDSNLAISHRVRLNQFIEASLKRGDFIKKCRTCSKALPKEYEHNICQNCFIQHKRQYRRVNGFRETKEYQEKRKKGRRR